MGEQIDRRFRRVRDLTPFELQPLLGDGVGNADMKQLRDTLSDSYALERRVDGHWKVVGVTGLEPRASEWVENDIALEVAGRVSAGDVKAWCEARLAAYKQPAVVEVVDA